MIEDIVLTVLFTCFVILVGKRVTKNVDYTDTPVGNKF